MSSDEETTLSPRAAVVWQAYRDMASSKDAHFDELARLQTKRERGERVTLSEQAYLDGLLAHHDAQVKAFAVVSRQLARDAPEDHEQVVALMVAAAGGEH